MISFNVPPCVGDEEGYIHEVIESHRLSGDGKFTKLCNKWMEEKFDAQKVMITTSGSTALDGSSNNIMGGLHIIAMATDNFLLFPPDKVPLTLSLNIVKLISSIKAFTINSILSFVAPFINP